MPQDSGDDPIAETAESTQTEDRPDRPEDGNRAIWFIIVGLIVVLAVAGTIAGSSSTTSAAPSGMRAVVVPTVDASRTVIVAPCGTGASVLSANANAVMETTGSTSIELPQGHGTRIVMVPACSGGHGGAAGTGSLPSAAFVAPPGIAGPSIGTAASQNSSPQRAGAPDFAQFELTVPAGSSIRTIVVSPCEKARPSGPAEQILSASGNTSTAVAPAC